MKEFDYLVSWVKGLCDKGENIQFESALLEAEAHGEKGLPTVWAYIWYKIESEIGSHDGTDVGGHPTGNPRYIGFLDLCKKNPTLADELKNTLNSLSDAGLGENLTKVMGMKYPAGDFRACPLWKPWDKTVQSANDHQERNETVQSANDQPMPMRNFMKDKHDEQSSKYIK